MDYLKNYINGNYCDAASGKWIDNYNPSDGSVYAQIPDSSKQDVANAYTAAQDAFPEWSGSGRSKRQR
jgi:aminomuconate-semialdehyde/2-hydroxymuconate-6-semialdehyde dehydrogenase